MKNFKSEVWKVIDGLAKKQNVSEITINGPESIFVEVEGRFSQLSQSLKKEDLFLFTEEVLSYSKKKAPLSHLFDGLLPDGSRINIVFPPVTRSYPAISIRRYLIFDQTFKNNPSLFALGGMWTEFLRAAVLSRLNIIVSGGTGVGKTTLLNLLLHEVSPSERIVSIEDTRELTLKARNCVRMEILGQTVSIRDLVKNCLRMRPDRIIVGESRGGEIFDLFQAMNTGHDGSMSSIHSNSIRECLQRIETLFLMSGVEVPLPLVRRQMASAIDLIIQLGRDKEGKRIVTSIAEVTGIESDNLLVQDIAQRSGKQLKRTGLVPACIDRLAETGLIPRDYFK